MNFTAPEGEYDGYVYVRNNAPLQVPAPAAVGTYEVRLCAAASPYATLARRDIVLESVTAVVEAPTQVKAGAEFQVRWSGPANATDYVAVGSATQPYFDYKYTRDGSPVAIRAPDEPGAGEPEQGASKDD